MAFPGIVASVRNVLRFLLKSPVTWLANKVASAPDKNAVLEALTDLYRESKNLKSRKIKRINLDPSKKKLIIFSDQHRGARDGSDDFSICEKTYNTALEYYNEKDFYYINLGDCEELWENTMFGIAKHNKSVYERERLFILRNAYCKIFGNHDLFWDNDPLSRVWLKKIYGKSISIYTGALVHLNFDSGKWLDIFCTHGHQGDKQSDGNAFSKWFVSYVWGPLQKVLDININSPSANDNLKTLHNMYMYDWIAMQKNLLLVTGHTHQPVFNSLTHLERLYQRLQKAQTLNDKDALEKIEDELPRGKRQYDFVNQKFDDMKPTYFNSGCCCFDDGTITGIEISDGMIRLIKWSIANGSPQRIIAEEENLESLSQF